MDRGKEEAKFLVWGRICQQHSDNNSMENWDHTWSVTLASVWPSTTLPKKQLITIIFLKNCHHSGCSTKNAYKNRKNRVQVMKVKIWWEIKFLRITCMLGKTTSRKISSFMTAIDSINIWKDICSLGLMRVLTFNSIKLTQLQLIHTDQKMICANIRK